MPDGSKTLTKKDLQAILKKLPPEQLKMIQARILDVFAQHKRLQFKLLPGGGRRNCPAPKP